ncbi:MAG: carboxypeptidase-like regulatory domain-containing protein [Salinivirgaceae bacterium]|jgi:iron complex outermembrane receptor protein|nr:carboxypeptidase-like regulatory domain-containing protein [Salinivirgaceae bacterium]
MKHFILLTILFATSISTFAQDLYIRGIVQDAKTGETLIGANVIYGEGQGTVTNFDGKFELKLPQGAYTLNISYVGYTKIEQNILIDQKSIYKEFQMESEVIDEVIIVADVARQRETPVAFTNVLPAKISEELAGKDLPMVLNSTPGVYATQQGGGDGDARITIRGFSQNNIAVMIDGIPVNDMENGWVYWSNWFGLDAIMRSMQVQRGLGISKLALPSVGGTMNIITKGIESEREGTIKQYIDNDGKLQTTLGYSSGLLKKGWGFTLATSYKQGNTWIDETGTKGWFYYFKVDKRWNNHITSLTGFGAPQEHDQRSYKRSIAAYNLEYARNVGIDVDAVDEKGNYIYRPDVNNIGTQYNYHWGTLRRDRYDSNAPLETQNSKINEYHKPQFSIRDSWNVNDKLFFSNTAYLSIGRGGGISPRSSIKNNQLVQDPTNPYYGQTNFQSIYDQNTKTIQTPFGVQEPYDLNYSNSLFVSNNYLAKSSNEHIWYGYLSSIDYTLNPTISISGGIDLRSYKGSHYMTVYDLMGGDYAIDTDDNRMTDSTQHMKKEGDKIYYYEDGFVRYGGAFGQLEYKTGLLTTFINVSTALTGYNKKDYFKQTESGWKNKSSFTIKGGANYNFTERSNVFMNLGYLSKVRPFNSFYSGYTTNFVKNTENERVKAIEIGYSYSSPKFSANFNGYFTQWENKPVNSITDKIEDADGTEVDVIGTIPGMDARHTGIEIDFIYKILHNLEFQGLVSLGDWIWDKKVDNLLMYPTTDGYDRDIPIDTITFDVTGIHVGDAAQTQLGASLRYEPIKGLYLSARTTYFARYYSDYNAESTKGPDGKPKEPWIIPSYNLIDFHTGYRFKFNTLDKITFNVRASVTNVLNTMYISDAKNNSGYIQKQFNEFDAKSAEVFFGAPRRYILSLKITF